jgi:hypothetical protein
MPCGGIIPIKGTWVEKFHDPKHPCWQCNKGDCDVFCQEWDTPLHSKCVRAFLETEEGKIVLAHKHMVVIVKEDGELEELFEEGDVEVEQHAPDSGG